MKEKDWRLKVRLEEELQIHPSYGSRRIATALGTLPPADAEGHASVWHQALPQERQKMEKIQGFPDLSQPPARGHARICKPHLGSDFTEFVQHGKKVYVATVIDLYTRRILGIQVTVRKGAALTIQALSNAPASIIRARIYSTPTTGGSMTRWRSLKSLMDAAS